MTSALAVGSRLNEIRMTSASIPDQHGRFGAYGGRYVPETLMFALRQLGEHYEHARADPEFQKQFDYYLRDYVGRPSPLYFAERLTKEAGGARIFLKREDLNHTGAHKINNCIGQALLTRRMGKPRVIAETGTGTKQHCPTQIGRLPDVVVACVGGGSNSAGMFFPFVGDHDVELVGVEAGGRGYQTGEHASTLSQGKPGVLNGSFSYVLQDADGQTAAVHSVSAGLDYPGVGPEHSYWKDSGRVRYTNIDDADALNGFDLCSRLEGILPALETAHAVVEGMRVAAKRAKEDTVLICFSGRGDKDCFEVAALRGEEIS